jgi:hypothetical protein
MKRLWVRRIKIGVIGLMAVGLFGFLVMSLWNWLGPAVFGLQAITFWQALGILVLSKLLFGGFGGRPRRGGHFSRRMIARWEQMSPEEREKFRQGMGGCGRTSIAAEPSQGTV